jgi:hypothetical protein
VELRRQDLLVYELDRAALARRLADAIGLVYAYAEASNMPNAVRIGLRDAMLAGEERTYLVTPGGAAALEETLTYLCAHEEHPFALLTPTRASWCECPAAIRARARMLAVEDAFLVDEAGNWTLAAPPQAVAGRRPERRLTPLPQGPTESAGQQPILLTGPQELVLAIVVASKTLMFQAGVIAATGEYGRKMSRVTVGKLLRQLAESDLLDYPKGSRKGIRVAPLGRARARPLSDFPLNERKGAR